MYNNNNSYKFEVSKNLLSDFLGFYNEEMNLHTTSDNHVVSDYIKKNILFPILSDTEYYYIAYILCLFSEYKYEINDSSLIQFKIEYLRELEPKKILLTNEFRKYITIKYASKFLSSMKPNSNFDLWKNYLSDNRFILQDGYYSSDIYQKQIEENANKLILIFENIIEIQKKIDKKESFNFILNKNNLLKTDLILNKPLKYKNILKDLMAQGIITPFDNINKYNTKIPLFEYTLLRSDDGSLWWLDYCLENYNEHLDFKRLLEFNLEKGKHLSSFANEWKNYQYIIDKIKKINSKNLLEKLLDEKEESDRFSKI